LLKPEELLTIEDFSSKNLKELMLKELIEKGFLEKDKVESFLHLVNHSRMPSALFAYIKNFIDNESMKTIIAVFIKSLIEKTFAKLRHENNSYKELLSEEQIRLWQTDKCMKFDATHQVFDSENWEDLFLCGTEVLSCQRVDGFVDYNKCLMGYVCDGKVRILCLKDHEGGPIKARCMLKIVKIGDGSPCLLLEKLYPEHRQEDYVFFKRCALSIAGGLKMPVFEGSELATGLIVYSDKKNPALWEYSDSGSGITDGTYEAKVRVLEP
jgi:hypothetical protein